MALSFLKNIWALKSLWVTVIAVLIPLPLVVLNLEGDVKYQSESRCAYMIVMMAILWLTEALPISATALMPIFIAPMLGFTSAKVMSGSYVTDTSMLFLGGLILAVAIETCGLHRRIALGVMRIVGAQPILLMVGLMIPTWFLSMWISNTAATAMMLPIIQAVIKVLDDVHKQSFGDIGVDHNGYEMETPYPDKYTKTDTIDSNVSATSYQNVHKNSLPVTPGAVSRGAAEQKRYAKGFALCVAYAANIGGIATLTGTPPNLVLKETADLNFQDLSGRDSGINFANWMGFAFPLSLLMLVLAWAWLQFLFIRCGCCRRMAPDAKMAIKSAVRGQYDALGPIKFSEIVVSFVFITLVFLWLFRSPPNIDGWGVAFEPKTVSDSTPVMLLCLILFIMPAHLPEVFCWAKNYSKPVYTPILTWRAVQEKVPWGVIILLGGGFALAKASTVSGLSQYVGNKLSIFSDQDPWVMNLIICIIVALATEVTSNTATSQLLLPIMFSLSINISSHPLYLMISTAIACSFAFMLPVATPPNAIVFSTGYLSIPDMALAGLPMNVIAIACLTFAVNVWGKSMYDLDTFPSYLQNITTTAAP